MPSVDINWIAVVVAAVVNMVVGAMWYSPSMFGKAWSKLVGRSLEDMKSGASTGYVVTTIGALIQAYVLSLFVRYAGATTAVDGVQVGFWLWLGFTAVTMASNNVFAGRPWKLWKIDSGYFLAVLLINGALLAVWT